MKYYILTIFTDMVFNSLNHSIIKRAMEKDIIKIETIDIREFSKDKHKKVDDYPYGGGVGMVMSALPIYDAFLSIKEKITNKTKVIYLTPQGKTFNQKMALDLSKEKELVFLCGHYEGIDERVLEEIVTDEISIGDFILTGGELASAVIIDSISRLIPGVLGNDASSISESFSNNLLEYPQYTRPYEFLNKKVPEVLLSGHHLNIEKWREEQAIIRTEQKRPDLLN